MNSLPQGKTFLTSNHEMACLSYEEAEKRGFDACYGNWPDGGYYVEVIGCTLEEFSELLKAAEDQAVKNAQQLSLWDTRQLQAATLQAA